MPKKILVPVDLSDEPHAKSLMQAALEQWRTSKDPELIFMTVLPQMMAGLDWRYAIRGETGGSEEWDVKKALSFSLKALEEIASEEIPDGVTFQTIARHGGVAEEVLEVAEELGVDQIVLGAHRPGATDFLLGTNTARIVRHAKCSVTVVRD